MHTDDFDDSWMKDWLQKYPSGLCSYIVNSATRSIQGRRYFRATEEVLPLFGNYSRSQANVGMIIDRSAISRIFFFTTLRSEDLSTFLAFSSFFNLANLQFRLLRPNHQTYVESPPIFGNLNNSGF